MITRPSIRYISNPLAAGCYYSPPYRSSTIVRYRRWWLGLFPLVRVGIHELEGYGEPDGFDGWDYVHEWDTASRVYGPPGVVQLWHALRHWKMWARALGLMVTIHPGSEPVWRWGKWANR